MVLRAGSPLVLLVVGCSVLSFSEAAFPHYLSAFDIKVKPQHFGTSQVSTGRRLSQYPANGATFAAASADITPSAGSAQLPHGLAAAHAQPAQNAMGSSVHTTSTEFGATHASAGARSAGQLSQPEDPTVDTSVPHKPSEAKSHVSHGEGDHHSSSHVASGTVGHDAGQAPAASIPGASVSSHTSPGSESYTAGGPVTGHEVVTGGTRRRLTSFYTADWGSIPSGGFAASAPNHDSMHGTGRTLTQYGSSAGSYGTGYGGSASQPGYGSSAGSSYGTASTSYGSSAGYGGASPATAGYGAAAATGASPTASYAGYSTGAAPSGSSSYGGASASGGYSSSAGYGAAPSGGYGEGGGGGGLSLEPEVKYYGQEGGGHDFPDKLVHETFFRTPIADGKFVEVGAMDGVKKSNTLFFERHLGWSGLLIEGSKANFKKLSANQPAWRPKSQIVNAAICPSARTTEFLGDGGTAIDMNLQPPGWIQKWGGFWKDAGPYTVACKPLNQLFLEARLSKIDFMSLDVCGAEAEALKTLDTTQVQVKVICAECAGGSAKDAECRNILEMKGFCHVFTRGSNTYYVSDPAMKSQFCGRM